MISELIDVKKNIRILRYIINDNLSIYRLYDNLVNNALYGSMIDILHPKNKDIIQIMEYFKKNNIPIKKVNVPVIRRYNTLFPIETKFLCTLAKGIDAENIFEFGTYKGTTTTNLAYNISKDGKIYSLCLPQELCDFEVGEVIQIYKNILSNDNIELLSGDSQVYDFKPFYNKMDMVFVDGGHTYDIVRSDSINAFKCVKKGGFIIWDDYDIYHLDLAKAVYEVCKYFNAELYRIDGTKFGIIKKSG